MQDRANGGLRRNLVHIITSQLAADTLQGHITLAQILHDLLDIGNDYGVFVNWNRLLGRLVWNTVSVHILDFAASQPCYLFCSESESFSIRSLTHTEQLNDVLLIEVLGFPLPHYFSTSVRTVNPKC